MPPRCCSRIPPACPEHQDIATAVNEQGDIAGYAVSADTGRLAPVVWRGRRHIPTLLPAPNVYQDVTGINEHGTVVGTAVDGSGYRTVIWTGRDRHEVTVTAPGESALGRAINDKGQVAGTLPDTSEAFRWDPRTGRTTTLEGLSPYVTAYGMNNRGCVVGSSVLPDSSTRATLFSPC
jgi:uncharacterized membrane protein